MSGKHSEEYPTVVYNKAWTTTGQSQTLHYNSNCANTVLYVYATFNSTFHIVASAYSIEAT